MSHPILCADIGSSSLKAALIGCNSEVLSFVRKDIAQNTCYTGILWVTALSEVIHELTKKYSIEPEAVCISGNGPTIVAPDGETLLWNAPVSSGLPQTNSLFIPRLLTFKKKYPELWSKIPVIFSGPEYLIYQLTGEPVTILPEQRYSSAYWTEEELDRCGFSTQDKAKLPSFIAATDLAGILNTHGAQITGLSKGTPVFCGGPDFIAAMIGTNTLHPGALCDRAGSSEGINFCTPDPVIENGIRTLPSVIPNLWFADIIIPDSGSRFASYRKRIEKKTGYARSYEDLTTDLIKKDNETLDYPEGREIITSIADKVGLAVKKLKKMAITHQFPLPEMMILTGGQAYNEVWVQFKANTSNIPVAINSCKDAELTGDNIIARVGLKEYTTISEAADSLVKIEKIYYPKKVNL
jgi:xylulokinase